MLAHLSRTPGAGIMGGHDAQQTYRAADEATRGGGMASAGGSFVTGLLTGHQIAKAHAAPPGPASGPSAAPVSSHAEAPATAALSTAAAAASEAGAAPRVVQDATAAELAREATRAPLVERAPPKAPLSERVAEWVSQRAFGSADQDLQRTLQRIETETTADGRVAAYLAETRRPRPFADWTRHPAEAARIFQETHGFSVFDEAPDLPLDARLAMLRRE